MSTLLEARNVTRHYAVSQGFLKPKGLVRALDGAVVYDKLASPSELPGR